ncbi:MAG: AMP-binding protein [Opitutales bacterium]
MSTADARNTMIDMASEAFSRRPELDENLGHALVRHLCEGSTAELAVDYAVGEKRFSRGKALAVAATLARDLKSRCPERRVGIVLPPGLAGLLTNYAVVLAGKTPVNLNYTAGRDAIESAVEQAGLRTMITAQKLKDDFEKRFPDFPWLDNTIDVREVLMSLPKWHTALVWGATRLLPGGVLANWLAAKRKGGNEEAGLLFTSGSEGKPKGAILSHRNIIGNCEQVRELGIVPRKCPLLCNLPIFHSFGFTVQLFVPVFTGARAVFTPSPLDFKLAAQAIEKDQAEVLLGTPTFFRPYLTKVQPEQLKSVRLVVAGAEKVPESFHKKWVERFPDKTFLEGYGLTETSPIATLNIPDIPPSEERPEGFTGTRAGSVGKPLAGMVARVVDPESEEPLPQGSVGILQLKGPNVFTGYLEQPEKTAEMLRDNGTWLHTGDLARIDEDGFIFIEGRLSRFSKLGGEMVPHGTIEKALNDAYDFPLDEPPRIAVSARQDEAKGEILVLLTTEELTQEDVRAKLSERGFSNLWIPKKVKKVDEIPMLPTGKMNLKAIREMAKED